MSQIHWINRPHWILLVLLLLVQSCASTKLPPSEETETMKQIFERSLASVEPEAIDRPVDYMDDHPLRLSEYTRSVETETSNLFEWLPNPTMFYYRFPHTKGSEGLPIPGYTVPFKFYERNHFALPGEVTPRG